MSIVLKANELNTIIYKYLLEAGLNHTAYTFFNEASLAQPLHEFRFDVKAGHLLSLLEKSLIYSQIEAHVCMNEYMQCSQPFYLLKAHTCKIVEKAKKEKQEIIKQLENQLNDSIKRTNSIYNTAVLNKNYDEITYEAKATKYFDKFAKIKFPPQQYQEGKYVLKGQFEKPILYIPNYQIAILRYDSLNQEVTIQKVVSCIKNGRLEQPITFAYLGQAMIQIYAGNDITYLILKDNEFVDPIEFNIQANTQINSIEINQNIPELLGLNADNQYFILNLTNMTILQRGMGNFVWRDYDEYLVITDEEIKLKQISMGGQIISFLTDRRWRQIKFNSTKTLFIAVSRLSRIMQVFTFDQQIPLFIFDEEQSKDLREVIWINSNGVDYICWLTNNKIKVYDISLNAYAKIIQLQKYEASITRLCSLRKSDKDQSFLIGLGNDNVIIFDINNSEVQRIEVDFTIEDICTINPWLLGMLTDSCIYFLVPEYIEKLFK